MPATFVSRTFLRHSLAAALVFGSFAAPGAAAASSLPVTGWAWAGTDGGAGSYMGWISFSNTTDTGNPSPPSPVYGVNEDSVTGALSGYAWSSNLGWITFNAADVATCPGVSCCPSGTSVSCTPKVDLANGPVTGWARACSFFASGCSGASATGIGNWDGWISLAGVTQNLSTRVWSGYAWGSDAIGAIDMTGVSESAPIAITVSPTSYSATLPNSTVSATYTLTNGTSANTNCRLLDSNGSSLTAYAPCNGTMSVTAPASAGTYGYSIQANKSSTGETVTSNNFGVTVVPITPTANLTVSKTQGGTYGPAITIDQGQTAWFRWSSTNALSCGSPDFATDNAASNSTGVKPPAPPAAGINTPSLICYSGANLTGIASGPATVTVTVVAPTISIKAVPTCVSGGGNSTVSWSATPANQITGCMISGPGLSVTQSTSPFTGSRVVPVSSKSTYTISCTTGGGGTIAKSVTVDVSACWTEF